MLLCVFLLGTGLVMADVVAVVDMVAVLGDTGHNFLVVPAW